MARKISDSVVVITGASSGIGRATALEFAGRGARLVLTARRGPALREVASECEARGGRARAVAGDVTDESALRAVAAAAIESHGRIDVWVNNAGVTLFSRFEDAPADAYRRVIETNLFGCINGARAALPWFREQGEGVLINVASVAAAAPQPYTSAYVTSKYGIRGFSECLRMELRLDGLDGVHVCTVLPAAIDTPFFEHAANYTGRAIRPIPPVYPPERVAQVIVGLARRPRREVFIGAPGLMLAAHHALTPGLYERTGAWLVDRVHLAPEPAASTAGNLFEPIPEFAAVHGGWTNGRGASTVARVAAAIGAAVALPAFALWPLRR